MEEFGDYAEKIASQYLSINNSYAYLKHLEYGYGVITIHWEESARCCVIDGGTIDMPIQYLWEPDWKAKMIAEQEDIKAKNKAKAKKEADALKRKMAKDNRKRELAQLAKLKLKYEE